MLEIQGCITHLFVGTARPRGAGVVHTRGQAKFWLRARLRHCHESLLHLRSCYSSIQRFMFIILSCVAACMTLSCVDNGAKDNRHGDHYAQPTGRPWFRTVRDQVRYLSSEGI
jgi:hypothetical protein